LRRIDEKYRVAAKKMFTALRKYTPKKDNTEEQPFKKTAGKDDIYWLTKLAKLSTKLSKTSSG
jgi:hypothetical protein